VIYSELSGYLESVVLNADPVLIIVGDFNIHVDCDDNTDAVKLLELFENVGLDQHVHTPAHCSGHTLDLIVTRQTDHIIASSSRADCLFSDHMTVFCQLQLDSMSSSN
jgi:endonuclease/exonuclease/phosphatase family metal-dependent hydrolase